MNQFLCSRNQSILNDYPYLDLVYNRVLKVKQGTSICLEYDEPKEASFLLSRGILISSYGTRMLPGRPNKCHHNSADCWQANKKNTRIATGYALSADGIWRQHSWCMLAIHGDLPDLSLKKKTGWRPVETTVKRELYFGYILTEQECEEFVKNHE
jgi:hypothetical protein